MHANDSYPLIELELRQGTKALMRTRAYVCMTQAKTRELTLSKDLSRSKGTIACDGLSMGRELCGNKDLSGLRELTCQKDVSCSRELLKKTDLQHPSEL